MKKLIPAAAVLLLVSLLLTGLAASAGTVLTETVDVTSFTRNMSGAGYEWNNRTRVLTLKNLNLSTSRPYGLKVPDGSTVILEGENVIEASYAALSTEGEVTFKGSGSLTLRGGTYALYGYGTNKNRVTRFMGVTVRAEAGEAGFFFDYEKLLFEDGCTVEFRKSAPDALACDAVVLKVLDSDLTSDATLRVRQTLVVQNSNLSVFSETGQAVDSPRSTSFDCVRLLAGETEKTAKEISADGGEAFLRTEATGRADRGSFIFGPSVPSWVDPVLIVLGVLAISAVIALPILRQRKKDKKARETFQSRYGKQE